MSRTPREVTDAELAVLRVLWERERATIRELTGRLYPGGGPSSYATVQKLLERLECKGCVKRERGDGAHRFTAAVCRDELIGRRLRGMADALCGGSLAPLLAHLVKAERLGPAQRRALRELIDGADAPRRPDRRKP